MKKWDFNPLSLYRERPTWNRLIYREWHFNPLSLYRERLTGPIRKADKKSISIHSPYTGRDLGWEVPNPINSIFQSTLPIQGETRTLSRNSSNVPYFNPLSLYRERLTGPSRKADKKRISIHSPYTGRDLSYPRDPARGKIFQSTLPIQGETSYQR